METGRIVGVNLALQFSEDWSKSNERCASQSLEAGTGQMRLPWTRPKDSSSHGSDPAAPPTVLGLRRSRSIRDAAVSGWASHLPCLIVTGQVYELLRLMDAQ